MPPTNRKLSAYVIGLALGDGNLSNPNGRATRLRIFCDKKYPLLLEHIAKSLSLLFPENKIGLINGRGHVVVSIYSNKLEKLLGWKWDCGPKDKQNVSVPSWIRTNKILTKECLRGLLQTDGSIYNDRGYTMVNFVNTCAPLANHVVNMMQSIGYKPNLQKLAQANGKTKHTIRLARKTEKFIQDINFWKN